MVPTRGPKIEAWSLKALPWILLAPTLAPKAPTLVPKASIVTQMAAFSVPKWTPK